MQLVHVASSSWAPGGNSFGTHVLGESFPLGFNRPTCGRLGVTVDIHVSFSFDFHRLLHRTAEVIHAEVDEAGLDGN